MPVLIKVSKVTSPKSLGYGKHYGHVVTTKTMSYQELCKHMKLQSCMLEQLLEGKKVQFGDLGTFYLSVKTKGEEKEEDFNMGTSIQGLRLRFSPSRQDINDLSSKTLKKRASFMNAKDLIDAKAKKTQEGGE